MPDETEIPAEDTAPFPVPLPRFLARLKGTPDQVWSRLLTAAHGKERHTQAEWLEVLAGYKSSPASARSV